MILCEGYLLSPLLEPMSLIETYRALLCLASYEINLTQSHSAALLHDDKVVCFHQNTNHQIP